MENWQEADLQDCHTATVTRTVPQGEHTGRAYKPWNRLGIKGSPRDWLPLRRTQAYPKDGSKGNPVHHPS